VNAWKARYIEACKIRKQEREVREKDDNDDGEDNEDKVLTDVCLVKSNLVLVTGKDS
jgi:hypothetical protein